MNHQYVNQGYGPYPQQIHPQMVPNPTILQNRFVYVNQTLVNSIIKPKVLINPHFKQKVYVNPQFKPPQKPKIHVNPNVLKNFKPPEVPKPIKPTKTVVSTRTKIVRVPCGATPEKPIRKRISSIHTKYKIVRTSESPKNKFKLDKRILPTAIKPMKKKYVYVNRFLSMSVMAKNVLLKQNSNLRKSGFVNINGILYKNSANSLRKTSLSSFTKPKPSHSSQYKIIRKAQSAPTNRKSLVRRHKIIRSAKVATKASLKKCNMPCQTYRKYGKCKGKEDGSCIRLHNPDQIVLCTRFLQGACLNTSCALSHKVSLEKMPTCKYFLEGLCSRDDCPYLHVRISPKADICKDFLEGYCKKGALCDNRHQFLCPNFEKDKKCPRKRCPYPHGNTVRSRKVNTVAKKCSTKRAQFRKKVRICEKKGETLDKNRYYKECDTAAGDGKVIETVSHSRPKLGSLPAFIPFFEGT